MYARRKNYFKGEDRGIIETPEYFNANLSIHQLSINCCTNVQEESGRHSSVLLELLAADLGVKAEAIVDLELTLCDTQPGAIWGVT